MTFRSCSLETPSVPKIIYDDSLEFDDVDACHAKRERRRADPTRKPRHSPPERVTRNEEFKCGHCRTFVGPPISGGRHRNHCPLCLYSRHVDRQTPGDRLSDCRSLMEPVGTWFRRNGEQVIVHRCLGCGVERNCRVAADDNVIAGIQLKLRPGNEPAHSSAEEPLETIA